MEENLKIWNDAKRIVVKVGSSLVTNEGHGVDTEAIARWTAQIAKLQEMGKQVVWVSSGAVAEGMARLGWIRGHRSRGIGLVEESEKRDRHAGIYRGSD